MPSTPRSWDEAPYEATNSSIPRGSLLRPRRTLRPPDAISANDRKATSWVRKALSTRMSDYHAGLLFDRRAAASDGCLDHTTNGTSALTLGRAVVNPIYLLVKKQTSPQSHSEAMRGLISLGSAKITSARSPGYRHPRGLAAGEPRRRIRSTKYCTVPKQPTSPSSTRADSNSSLISPP